VYYTNFVNSILHYSWNNVHVSKIPVNLEKTDRQFKENKV